MLRAIVRSAPRSASAWVRVVIPPKRIRSRSPNGRGDSMTTSRATPPGRRAVRDFPGSKRSGASLHTSTTTSPASPWARAIEPTRIGSSGSSVGNLEHGPPVLRARGRGEKGAQRVRGLPFPADHFSEVRGADPQGVDRGLPVDTLIHVHEVRVVDQVPRAVFDERFQPGGITHFFDFFAFLAFLGFAMPLAFFAFALARLLAFFSLAFVAFRGARFAFGAAFFAFLVFVAFPGFGSAPGSGTRPGSTGSGAGRSAPGACLAIMTSTDSEGRAPFRIHCSNFPVSIWNFAGSVSGS